MSNSNDIGKLILRITVGGLMLLHGIKKLSGIGGIEKAFEGIGLPGFLANLVYLGEIIAPIALIIGFRSKIGAILICGTMVIATLLKHSDDIFSLSRTGAWGIELQAFYFFASLAIFFLGSGKYAVSSKHKWD